jgi:hypothetical protein
MNNPNIQTPRKSKIIDDRRTTALAAAATTNGASVDTRGMTQISFSYVGVTVDQTTDETYNCKIQGRSHPDDAWVDIPSLAFTEQDTLTSYGQLLPTAATRDGIRTPRFIRVVHVIAGTTPSFAGYVEMTFDRDHTGPHATQNEYKGG